MAAVKFGPLLQSSNTLIRVSVKENRPGCGAEVSNPHAAIVSVTLVAWPLAGAPPAAAQQSRSSSTSAFACSKRVCIANHCSDA